jgi:hypothetical protein
VAKSLGGANFYAHRLSLTLAAPREPGSHGFRQAFGLYAGTHFEEAIGERERVVEFGLTGEVAHTEIIKPIEGASASLGTDDDFDADFVSEHERSITCGGLGQRVAPRCKFLAAAESAN